MSAFVSRSVHVRGHEVAAAFASARTDWPAVATLTWWTFDEPVLVLGSAQRDDVVDAAAATAAGVQVVRRASGGGAVLLAPDDALWVDVVVPRDDPRHDDDVIAAARWLGDAWVDALAALGVPRPALVRHGGGAVVTPWSPLVCFAGLGPGEVQVDGAKVVGISQRRGRAGARFQVAVLRRWEPVGILGLLALDPARRAAAAVELAHVATGVDAPPDRVRAAFEVAAG